MSISMLNLVECAHTLALPDRAAAPAIVDHALRAAGISRQVLQAEPVFLSHEIEAVFPESMARAGPLPHRAPDCDRAN